MRLIKKITSLFYRIYFKVKYNNFWDIKKDLIDDYKVSLELYYYHLLQRSNSWIGYNANFKGMPVFPHGINGVFISNEAVIGENAVIFHQVTIGSNTLRDSNFGSPTIGDNVYIGAGAKIIGNISIGNNCRIGANAVVYTDLSDNSVAVCSPTKVIQKTNLDNKFFKKINDEWFYYENNNWIKSNIL